jgi:IgA Peptidase M64
VTTHTASRLAIRLAITLPLLTPALSAQGDERKAAVELSKAMDAAGKGHYARAVALYKRVAKKWPATGAGIVALERSGKTAFLGWADIVRHGPSENRLDVVMMGDGYRLGDQNDFDDVAKSIPKLFKNHKVLGEYYTYHNFLRANLRSKDQGVSGFGRKKQTALGGRIAGKVQGQVGVDIGAVHRYLREIDDSDGLAIAIVKAGSMGTGGAGVAAIGGRSDDTVIHEWGHAFGGLSDEYSAFTGHRGTARNTVNISTYKDPKKSPWFHFIKKRVPGVGTYRGGDGRIKGVWRPTASGCAMMGGVTFCPVCREELLLRIYRYVDPIDDALPKPSTPLRGKGPFKFKVTLMKPKTHGLSVRWYILHPGQHIAATRVGPFKDRRKRGRLQAIAGKPEKTRATTSRPVQSFKFDPKRRPAGTYQIVCRVEDRARPSGQQHPWVLRDTEQLLQSERCWTVQLIAR